MKYGYMDKHGKYVRFPQIADLVHDSGPARGIGTHSGPSLRRRLSGWFFGNRSLALIAILCAMLVLGGTIAYMVAITNKETNAFTFGKTDIEIEEEFEGWAAKEVQLENTGEIPGVVRAMIVPVLIDKATGEGRGGNLGLMGAPTGDVIVMGDFTFELAADWESNWFYKDGYFYYRKVLPPGAQTTLLLQKVSLTNLTQELWEQYKDILVDVEVLADILQAEGNAASDAWGVQVIGDTVSP